MIELYTANTPNGRKPVILLEELGLKYNRHDVSLKDNEQKKPDFIAMNPNGRIPAMVDNEGPSGKQTVFESAAILYYLAEKSGKYCGKNLSEKTDIMQWMMFQMSAVGPMFGNYHFGTNMNPANPGYVERFDKESRRLVSVLEIQLSKHDYLALNEYTIADMTTYPWVAAMLEKKAEWFENAPGVRRWAERLAARPAVKKAMA